MEMIELKSRQQLKSAIDRARREAGNLIVRRTGSPRRYSVTNRVNGKVYLVSFYVEGGKRLGDCTCLAGQNGLACKHVAAAAALNIYLAGHGLLDSQTPSAGFKAR